MKVSHLTEDMLRCIGPAERKKLGLKTAEEAIAAGEAKTEKQLQKQIISLLRLKGIEPIVSRMDRKTSNNVGTPDILFAVIGYNGYQMLPRIYACSWEVKLPGKHLDEAQRSMRKVMTSSPNHWTHRVIHSVDEALKELNQMGIE